jgi:hypothetical protein
MIIDQQSGLVFIHIPKTGGTSLHNWLRSQNSLVIAFWGQRDGLDQAHLTLQQAQAIIPSFPKEYFRVAFVRHPYDRVYSAYLQPYRQVDGQLTFGQFLEKYVAPLEQPIKGDLDLDPKSVHLWPMHYFTTVNGRNDVHFIGRMENWQQDVEFIKEKFGYKGQPSHQNQNQNQTVSIEDQLYQSKYKKYYRPEQLELVDRVYRKDFEWFYGGGTQVPP